MGHSKLARAPRRMLALCAIAGALATAPAGAAPTATPAGIAWEFVDVIQSDLREEHAVRWDYVVALRGRADRAVQIERIEIGTGGKTLRERTVSPPLLLPKNGSLRIKHWDRAPSGQSRLEVYRHYHGHDEEGIAVSVEARTVFDAAARGPARRAGLPVAASPLPQVPIPSDARVTPPAAGAPAGLTALSGIWSGKYEGADGRESVLIVEEVGDASAQVVYAWGPGPAGRQGPGWERFRAPWSSSRLTVAFTPSTSTTYVLGEDGRLRGTFRGGKSTTRIVLARQTRSARTDADTADRGAALTREAWQAILDGQFTEALPKAEQAVTAREQALGKDHVKVAESAVVLAEAYRGLGRFDDAERLHRRALAIREASPGADRLDVARSLNQLALLQNARARYADAESSLARALKIVEQAPRASAPRYRLQAEVLESQAKVYRALGRTADADAAMARAMLLWAAQ